jgi:hypothetical protein
LTFTIAAASFITCQQLLQQNRLSQALPCSSHAWTAISVIELDDVLANHIVARYAPEWYQKAAWLHVGASVGHDNQLNSAPC